MKKIKKIAMAVTVLITCIATPAMAQLDVVVQQPADIPSGQYVPYNFWDTMTPSAKSTFLLSTAFNLVSIGNAGLATQISIDNNGKPSAGKSMAIAFTCGAAPNVFLAYRRNLATKLEVDRARQAGDPANLGGPALQMLVLHHVMGGMVSLACTAGLAYVLAGPSTSEGDGGAVDGQVNLSNQTRTLKTLDDSWGAFDDMRTYMERVKAATHAKAKYWWCTDGNGCKAARAKEARLENYEGIFHSKMNLLMQKMWQYHNARVKIEQSELLFQSATTQFSFQPEPWLAVQYAQNKVNGLSEEQSAKEAMGGIMAAVASNTKAYMREFGVNSATVQGATPQQVVNAINIELR